MTDLLWLGAVHALLFGVAAANFLLQSHAARGRPVGQTPPAQLWQRWVGQSDLFSHAV